mmetsp:Transcript_5084/g.14399  ORF Transcript_5084/g.14399 Transcript_5084/m.14399 type:complete len:841 (-) Transcript_5084:62-2584(-)|eukprot:CAMPEP_0118871372 /NCGR_PEP_ID=MMETSP1163-20130328/13979_1 /TAXON_ID=124430 /ORGANISM="Phaeomonas parva, Strain CCMP2877" /LENGTH=840 /DNA_ID=CAMNT_0006806465 /DNA_START=119 /DNA_END=2641 /DNA_ORIENTATION=-
MTSQAGGKARRLDVAEGICLYCTYRKLGKGTELTYELECARFNRVKFTLILSRTHNITTSDVEGTEVTIEDVEDGTDGTISICRVVDPFNREKVIVVSPKSAAEKTTFKTSFNWELLPPDAEKVAAIVRENEEELGREIDAADRYGFGDDSASVAEIERRCIMYKVKFLDADYPPCDLALYGDRGSDNVKLIWKRPEVWAIPDVETDVFVGGIEPGDIRQGALADCWFLCALSSLAEFEHLVKRLFLEESRKVNAHGVYKMRFCKNGQWQTVAVDDYFPCFPGGGPAYSKGHGNELWVLLLEKAYAKLHGSYAAIRMGWAFEAMLDLTGAPYKTIRLEEELNKGGHSVRTLWDSLLQWDLQGYIMSASTPGEDTFTETGTRPPKDGTGLVQGHAYTLLEAKQTSQGHRLVQVRNPWGNFEWTGDWSDTSDLWTDDILKEVGAVLDDKDGTFWMSLDDLIRHFFSINVCMVKHRVGGTTPWVEKRKKVCFNYSAHDGSVTTGSMYVLSITQATRVFLSVHQEDTRCANAKPYLDIGVTVMRIQPDYTYELVGSSGNTAERQNQTDEVFLTEGQYLVVPTTTGCKFRQGLREAEATQSSGEASLWKPGSEGRVLSPDAEHALNDIFRTLDVDLDGVLNRLELNSFLQLSEGCEVSDEVFEWLVSTFDSADGGLTPDGFRQCYIYMWEQSGRNDETIWRDLIFHGYNRQLSLLFSRTVMLVIHGDANFELHAQPFDPEAYEEAMELPIKAYGECKHFEDAMVKLYIRKAGYNGVSIAAENLRREDVNFTLDMTASENVTTHQKGLNHTELVPAGETKVLHHIMPTTPEDPWSWRYSPSAEPVR